MLSELLTKSALRLPRIIKRFLAILLDSCLCALSVYLAFYLRLGDWVPLFSYSEWNPKAALLVSLALATPIFIFSGLYRVIFRYAGFSALITVMKAVVLYGFFYVLVLTFIGIQGVPRTVGIIQPVLLLLAVGVTRILVSFWLGGLYQASRKKTSMHKIFIYGAGDAGRQLAAALANSREILVVGFLDDDQRFHGQTINRIPVYNPKELKNLVKSRGVSRILLAIPSASRKRRNEILSLILEEKLLVQTIPSMSDLAEGKVKTSDIRWLDIDDLLGRDPVKPNIQLLEMNIANAVVLVTGAGGSIGSELSRQIFALKPSTLLLVEQSEFALYQLHEELVARMGNSPDCLIEVIPLICSVCDEVRVDQIISAWTPDIIFHAAAYKHVPLVEHNLVEGVRNNVFGTLVMAKTAIKYRVHSFILISTDKAVRPTNVMGATKRLAENILQALASDMGGTKFSMVRFGNVLDSSGSVVPKFRQQILDGGPVTVTDPEITRYFMTIPEAAQLVIQASAMSVGGDVFVLDMGESVRIIDLARRMIELSGFTVKDASYEDGDIEISITGLRPGEKLYEELLIGNNPQATLHPRIMKTHEDFMEWQSLEPKLEELKCALDKLSPSELRAMMCNLIPEYKPNDRFVVDWIHLKRNSKFQNT